MSYIEKSLSEGENVEDVFRFHWWAWAPIWLWMLLAIPTFGLTLLVAGYQAVLLRATEQGVTTRRVIHKTGFIARLTEEMRLSSVETVEIRQSIAGRLLGFGDVKVTGYGLSDVVFRNIDDPIDVKRRIEGVLHRHGQPVRPHAASATPR